jgi:AAA ATPase domain
MINQLEIRNFRCFKNLKLHGLKRFNFMVGESGTGKTAILEAMFLGAGGNPEIWFRLRRWRGLGEGPIQIGVRETYEALFRDMFYGFDQKSGANIRILDSELGKRELEIYYKRSEVYTLPLQKDRDADAFAIDPIQFKWDFGNDIVYSQVEIKDGALRMTGNAKVTARCCSHAAIPTCGE